MPIRTKQNDSGGDTVFVAFKRGDNIVATAENSGLETGLPGAALGPVEERLVEPAAAKFLE